MGGEASEGVHGVDPRFCMDVCAFPFRSIPFISLSPSPVVTSLSIRQQARVIDLSQGTREGRHRLVV